MANIASDRAAPRMRRFAQVPRQPPDQGGGNGVIVGQLAGERRSDVVQRRVKEVSVRLLPGAGPPPDLGLSEHWRQHIRPHDQVVGAVRRKGKL
jgi:hypothetical protein